MVQIDEELQRLQDELESTKGAMLKAQAIFEECKVKQQRLVQELKAVDLMKQNLGGLKKEPEKEMQQPPEDYFDKGESDKDKEDEE
tara:strand:+ start:62 stop:319 length:258 start_codon:yes stop_codon:yes gene_type:complete